MLQHQTCEWICWRKVKGNKESELNDAVEVMFKFIDDYRTGYGGVTDSFIKKELHFFGREYSEILKDKSEK